MSLYNKKDIMSNIFTAKWSR